ncbi:MAG: hypothetical protein LBD59_11890 [Prevotellaceae bacterium]|nr:hypothetical protein [Prevotellaceae bacterium]
MLICTTSGVANAQPPEFSGYLTAMPSAIVLRPADEVMHQWLVHNRLNFGWSAAPFLRLDAGVRNRFMFGSASLTDPESTGFDAGWADLSWNWAEGRNLLGNTAFDRLYLTLETGKWKMQAGRQRINWGQTFVWNPNDIFNTHSFFDFDYPERLGCDALRITYFHSETASSEAAVSVARNGKITAAALHHWNRNNIDYQIIAGEHAQTDLLAGGACTGDFNGLNFRGEFSYFHPVNRFADTAGIFAASAGIDYVFPNSLMLQAEMLYNNTSAAPSGEGLMALYAAPLSAKRLSVSTWNIFAQASYPVTPRLNGALSSMYFADLGACYAGVSFDLSLANNLDLSCIMQYFTSLPSSALDNMSFLLGFIRLKYSF